jgi:hypothetical protein
MNFRPVPDLARQNKEQGADTASLCNQVRKWNIRFDGYADPVSFMERLNELIEAYEIPPNPARYARHFERKRSAVVEKQ